ncbi:MAG: helix-turn-helix domain-containing protein [Armatimonadota bacterium]
MINAFAENLRACRKSLGLTQEQLAEVSGLSTNYIARLEIGMSTPSFATLMKLSNALQVSASDLLAMEYESTAPSDLSIKIATLLGPLTDRETEYVLSQLQNSIHFVLSHRKDATSGK